MPERLLPSDPRYAKMDLLAQTLSLLNNPNIHLLGYGEGKTFSEIVINKFMSDADLAEAIAAVKLAQQEIIDSKQ